MIEQWKPVPGTDGLFDVSNFGRVRELGTGKMLKIYANSKGYAVTVILGQIRKVHTIVGTVFLCKPESSEPLQIDHIDRNRLNNEAGNLRWVTAKENRRNQNKRKKYQTHPRRNVKRICEESGEEIIFPSLKSAAESVGMGLSTIFERLHDGRPTKSGYKFIYSAGDKINGRI